MWIELTTIGGEKFYLNMDKVISVATVTEDDDMSVNLHPALRKNEKRTILILGFGGHQYYTVRESPEEIIQEMALAKIQEQTVMGETIGKALSVTMEVSSDVHDADPDFWGTDPFQR